MPLTEKKKKHFARQHGQFLWKNCLNMFNDESALNVPTKLRLWFQLLLWNHLEESLSALIRPDEIFGSIRSSGKKTAFCGIDQSWDSLPVSRSLTTTPDIDERVCIFLSFWRVFLKCRVSLRAVYMTVCPPRSPTPVLSDSGIGNCPPVFPQLHFQRRLQRKL